MSQQQGRRKVNYAAYAVGGVAGIAVLAGLGVGAAFLFGDLGATAANAGGRWVQVCVRRVTTTVIACSTVDPSVCVTHLLLW